jgi:hypothetical protein
VEGERATATLGFSATTQPDGFWLRVYGERMHAAANLFETRLTFDRVRPGPKPLRPVLNGLEEARSVRRASWAAGPQVHGRAGRLRRLWELLARTYRALADGSDLPVPTQQVLEVNRLIEALRPSGAAS